MEAGKESLMIFRIIGALLIILCCGGFGFALASNYKKEEQILRQFTNILDYISCELQYRLTPLPQLCRQAALECTGALNRSFMSFADELDMQLSADVELCMKAALARQEDFSPNINELMLLLGHSLGRFDIEGQLKELDYVRQECRNKIKTLVEHKDSRLRTYQTLGLCAGAALTILLI